MTNQFNKLSDETLLRIFEYLDWDELISIRRTCKKFRRISDDPVLWQGIYHRSQQLIMTPKKEAMNDYKNLYKISRNWSMGRAKSYSLPSASTSTSTSISAFRNTATLRIHKFTLTEGEQDLTQHNQIANIELKPIADIKVDMNVYSHTDNSIRLGLAFKDKSFKIFNFNTDTLRLTTVFYQRKPRIDGGLETVVYTSLNSPFYITCSTRFKLCIYKLENTSMTPTLVQAYQSPVAYHPASINLDTKYLKAIIAYVSPTFPNQYTVSVQSFPLTRVHGEECLVANASKSEPSRGLISRRTSKVLDIDTDGHWIALARDDNSIQVYELSEQVNEFKNKPIKSKFLKLQLHTTLGHNCAVSSVAIADRLVSGDLKGDIKIWNFKDNDYISQAGDISQRFPLFNKEGITIRESKVRNENNDRRDSIRYLTFDSTTVVSVSNESKMDMLRVYKFDV